MRRTNIGLAGLTAIVATMVLAGSVAAGSLDTWSGMTLRHANGVDLQDADFDGQNVVVVWQEPGQQLWLRRSDIWGDAFAPRESIATSARQAEVDICGDDAYISYARNVGGQWRIRAAETSVSSGGLGSRPVSFGSGKASEPDVACAGGRLFVAWRQRIAGEAHVLVDHARRDGGTFGGTVMDLGTHGFGKGPVVAGVNNRAYVAAQIGDPEADVPIVFHRWSVGGAPNHPVAYLGSTQITANGWDPVIAAAGTKVVVVWSDFGPFGNRLRARVSNDRGASWGPVRHLQPGGGGGIEDASYLSRSVAIRGSRIVLAFALVGCALTPGGGCGSTEYMMSTTDDFATKMRTRLAQDPGDPFGDPVVLGILATPEGPRLAAALDRGDRIRFLRKD